MHFFFNRWEPEVETVAMEDAKLSNELEQKETLETVIWTYVG